MLRSTRGQNPALLSGRRGVVTADPLSAMTRTRSERLTRRLPRAGDAWTHSVYVGAPPVERTICPALVQTVRRPGFTGRIALFWHRLFRIRFSAAMGLIGVEGICLGRLTTGLL